MRRTAMLWAGLTALLVLVAGSAQAALSAKQIIDRAMAVTAGVKDYTCTLTVKSHIPNMRLPERTVTVYMKRPNHVRVESGGRMVMVPRDVLLLGDFGQRIQNHAKLLLSGVGKSEGRRVYFVKIIPKPRQGGERGGPRAQGWQGRQDRQDGGGWHGGPNGRRGNFPTGPRKFLVWIWGDNFTLKKTEMWAGTTKIMTADWTYAKVRGHWMPSVIRSSFSGARIEHGGTGSITLRFSGWKINTGLSDKIFANEGHRGGNRQGGRGQWGQGRRWNRPQGAK